MRLDGFGIGTGNGALGTKELLYCRPGIGTV